MKLTRDGQHSEVVAKAFEKVVPRLTISLCTFAILVKDLVSWSSVRTKRMLGALARGSVVSALVCSPCPPSQEHTSTVATKTVADATPLNAALTLFRTNSLLTRSARQRHLA